MRLVLNADDFGYSDDTEEATNECFECSALTSATIMPAMPAAARAIAFARARQSTGGVWPLPDRMA